MVLAELLREGNFTSAEEDNDEVLLSFESSFSESMLIKVEEEGDIEVVLVVVVAAAVTVTVVVTTLPSNNAGGVLVRGSSSTVVFEADDPAVLLVVSSSLERSLISSSFLLRLMWEDEEEEEEEEEEKDDVVLTTTSGFLEITDFLITGRVELVANSFPVVFEGKTRGTTFSLPELLLSSRTSMIFVFLPFHAFFGGCGAPNVVVVVVVAAFAFEFKVESLLDPESVACLGVCVATGEVILAPRMLSLRPFQAIVSLTCA